MWSYFSDHRHEILSWAISHAWLAFAPLVVGLLIALPLGWVAARYGWLRAPVVSTAGLFYTIPSLALFVVMPGILHTQILDPVNVIAALTLYTVALMVRVVADGLSSVPDDVAQAATAMGYRRWRRFLAVDLPISVPVIGAGLRVAAVSNVSLVSVAALLGVPELGQLFTNGFQLFETGPVMLGILGCLLLALVFDAAILVLIRLLTPWRSAVSR